MKRADAETLALQRATRIARELRANGTPAPTADRHALQAVHERYGRNLTRKGFSRIRRALRERRSWA